MEDEDIFIDKATTMSNSLIKVLKNVVLNAFNKHTELYDQIKYIKEECERLYGGHWFTVAYRSGAGKSCGRSFKGCYFCCYLHGFIYKAYKIGSEMTETTQAPLDIPKISKMQTVSCPKCYITPRVKLIPSSLKSIYVSCSKCRIEEKVPITEFISDSSKFLHSQVQDCSNTEEHKRIPSTKFCQNCNSYYCDSCISKYHYLLFQDRHTLVETNKLVYKCDIHKKISDSYCMECQKSVCEGCILFDHKEHTIIPITDLIDKKFIDDIKDNLSKSYEKIYYKNAEIKDKVIQKIRNNIMKEEEEIKKIEKLYQENTKMNLDIIKMIEMLINNYYQQENNLNVNNVDNIRDNSVFNFNLLDVEKSKMNEVLKYFENDCIVDRKYYRFFQLNKGSGLGFDEDLKEKMESEKKMKCVRCNGDGIVPSTTCPLCKGDKVIDDVPYKECPTCKDRCGYEKPPSNIIKGTEVQFCKTCKGEGFMQI